MILIAIKVVFVALLSLAAISDARRFLIPNLYPACLILLAIAAWFAGFPFTPPLWSHLAHFAIALVVGMALFHFGWFGGGDVKLYAAVALWFGLSNGIFLLFVTGISGAAIVVLSVLWRVLRTAFGRGGGTKGGLMKRRIAYGVAVAAGGIVAMLWIYPVSTPPQFQPISLTR